MNGCAGSNKIEHLPPEIVLSLSNLRELHLYKNKISSIPPEIGNLQCALLSPLLSSPTLLLDRCVCMCALLAAIQKISLASNNLRGLPDEIGACTTLEELYLSNNAKLSYFPGSAGHLRYVGR